jgi:hypothetical protein
MVATKGRRKNLSKSAGLHLDHGSAGHLNRSRRGQLDEISPGDGGMCLQAKNVKPNPGRTLGRQSILQPFLSNMERRAAHNQVFVCSMHLEYSWIECVCVCACWHSVAEVSPMNSSHHGRYHQKPKASWIFWR